jgi:hypothetical protein
MYMNIVDDMIILCFVRQLFLCVVRGRYAWLLRARALVVCVYLIYGG